MLSARRFFRRGLIEKWGRGTQRIVEMCQAGGYPKPHFIEEAGMFTVRFPLGICAPPIRVRHDLTDRQQEILQTLADRKKRSFGEIYQQLSGDPAKRTTQAELRMLRDLKLVDFEGHGGSARWWLRIDTTE